MSTAIKIQNLSKYYSKSGWWKKQTQKTVLQEIDLELAENEVLGIVGESGCGKTTLAKVILGLEPYQ